MSKVSQKEDTKGSSYMCPVSKKGGSVLLSSADEIDIFDSSDGLAFSPRKAGNPKGLPSLNVNGIDFSGKWSNKSGKSALSPKKLRFLMEDTSCNFGEDGSLDCKDPNHDEWKIDENSTLEVWDTSSSFRVVPQRSNPYSCYHYHSGPDLDMNGFLEITLGSYEEFLVSKSLEMMSSVEERLIEVDYFIYHDAFVEMCLRKSLDKSHEEQAATSALVARLVFQKIVTEQQLNRALEKMVNICDDLVKDNPRAIEVILRYIESALADKCLSISFVSRLPENILNYAAKMGLNGFPDLAMHLPALQSYKARVAGLLHVYLDKNCNAEKQEVLDGLLGINEKYKKEVCELAKTGVDSGEEIFFPAHELVRRAIFMSMERGKKCCHKVAGLLVYLNGRDTGCLLSEDDIRFGFFRLLAAIEEMMVDIPRASSLMTKYVVRAIADEILPPAFVMNCRRMRFGGQFGIQIMQAAQRILDSPQSSHSQKLQSIFLESQVLVYVPEEDAVKKMFKWKAVSSGLLSISEEDREFKTALRGAIKDHFTSGRFDLQTLAAKFTAIGIVSGSDFAQEAVRKIICFCMEAAGTDEVFQESHLERLTEAVRYLQKRKVVDYGDIVAGVHQVDECLDDIQSDMPEVDNMFYSIFVAWKLKGLLRAEPKPVLPSNQSSVEDLSGFEIQDDSYSPAYRPSPDNLPRFCQGFASFDKVHKRPANITLSTIASCSSSKLLSSMASW